MPPRDDPLPRLLIIGTTNPGKFREFAELLADWPLKLRSLRDFAPMPALDESGSTLAENAALKARHYAHHTGHWVLADDTGLFVAALNGAPGLLTARYAGPHAAPADHRAKLLAALADVPLDQRRAHFACCLALISPVGAIAQTASGICYGRIRPDESGSGGFGYDSLFEIPEYHQTLAELGPAAHRRLSHRARAVERLKASFCARVVVG